VCGWTGWCILRLEDRIVLNYTIIKNAHEVRKKTSNFSLCIEVQQTFSFPFSLLRHNQIPESYAKICCFELVQQFYHATEIGNVLGALRPPTPIRTKSAVLETVEK